MYCLLSCVGFSIPTSLQASTTFIGQMADKQPSFTPCSNCSNSTVSDTIAVLELFFTQDQSKSYPFKTHLEISVEELKERIARMEVQIAKLNFLRESMRCNVVSLAKRVNGLDDHLRSRKRKKTCKFIYDSL